MSNHHRNSPASASQKFAGYHTNVGSAGYPANPRRTGPNRTVSTSSAAAPFRGSKFGLGHRRGRTTATISTWSREASSDAATIDCRTEASTAASKERHTDAVTAGTSVFITVTEMEKSPENARSFRRWYLAVPHLKVLLLQKSIVMTTGNRAERMWTMLDGEVAAVIIRFGYRWRS